MARINPHFTNLHTPYIFPIIEEKLADLQKNHPSATVINLGIGDIALPLVPAVVQAICQATEEMGHSTTRKGYGPSEGYPFLRKAIANHEYAHLDISWEEIFISDGTNTDTVNLPELFAHDSRVAIPNPTYPVYLAANTMAGRASSIIALPCTEETRFVPVPPDQPCDLIFLCSPNNPTGVALNRKELQAWVDYARSSHAIIIYDNAYVSFIRSPDVPLSIYEIEGAKEVAIECRSFSKSAGFTGLRCAYTIVPRSLPDGLHSMWKRRQATKSNGVAYPIQRGAEATFSKEGQFQVKAQVASYLEQATYLFDGLQKLGHLCYGGIDAPYIWWKTPKDLSSWDFFDRLLEQCHLIAVPGQGFGSYGEGYVRLSAFTTPNQAEEALCRIQQL